jgi:hypothetical protein
MFKKREPHPYEQGTDVPRSFEEFEPASQQTVQRLNFDVSASLKFQTDPEFG